MSTEDKKKKQQNIVESEQQKPAGKHKEVGGVWKEKLGNYLIDISKYLLTVVFVASLVQDLAAMRWLIYILSALISALLLIVGLILTNKRKAD